MSSPGYEEPGRLPTFKERLRRLGKDDEPEDDWRYKQREEDEETGGRPGVTKEAKLMLSDLPHRAADPERPCRVTDGGNAHKVEKQFLHSHDRRNPWSALKTSPSSRSQARR